MRFVANIFVFDACDRSNLINGEAGIRTRDTGLTPYNGLANRRLQPLGHLSGIVRWGLCQISRVCAKGRGKLVVGC